MVIDSDFRNEIIVALHNDSNERVTIEPYQRIAQLIIQPYIKVIDNVTSKEERGLRRECGLIEEWSGCTLNFVEEVNDTERGLGGLGSTGK